MLVEGNLKLVFRRKKTNIQYDRNYGFFVLGFQFRLFSCCILWCLVHEMHFVEGYHEICTRDTQKMLYTLYVHSRCGSLSIFSFDSMSMGIYDWWPYRTRIVSENRKQNEKSMKNENISFPSRDTDPDDDEKIEIIQRKKILYFCRFSFFLRFIVLLCYMKWLR